MPKPAPERAVTAMLGRYVSRIENVAAAVKAISATSSNLRRFWGITKAAIATIKPSTKYLIALLTNSPKSNISPKFIILNKKKKIKYIIFKKLKIKMK